MKTYLQSLFGLIFLSLSVGPAFAVDRVLIPLRTDNALAVGSTVMLEWELAPYRAVNLSLGGSEVPFAENIPNKGWYRWTIAQDIEADRKNVRILVTPVSGAKPVASKAFTLKALPAKERYRGRIQHYDADLSDRPQVTYPVEGETIGPGMPLDVRWDDPDNLLLDRIQVHLRAHHRPAPLKVWGQGNSGQFTLPESERARFAKACESEPGCYFVVRSTTHKERRITSGHFVFGEAAETDVYLVSLTTESPSQGAEFEIAWTDQGEVAHPVRVDLLKADAYYLTITESIDSTPGEDNTYSYSVPYTVAAGEDYRVEINAVGKPHHKGASDAFAIAGTGDKALSINAPKDPWVLAKRRTDGRITWKKPVKIKQVHVDLYKGDRRIRTVVDESKKRQLRWPVTRSLPTGEDYTLRIQDLADEATYAFSEAFCIRQSTENCDGTPKASAGKVIADTGSVSIVEVSAGTSDGSSGDVGGDTAIEAEKLAWECQLRNLPTTCQVKHIEAVDRVCDDKTLTGPFIDAKFYLERFTGEGFGESSLETFKSYGLDSLTEIAEISQQPRCKSEMEPLLGHAPAKGCGEGTIELAGVCVPDHDCPGYDALNDERSFFPSTTPSYRPLRKFKARVCDKYLLQGESREASYATARADDAILAGLLKHINEILRFKPHNEEFYRTIWALRNFDFDFSWETIKHYPGAKQVLGVEPPRVETFWSFEDGEAQRCLTSVIQRRNQRQIDVFETYCGDETESTMPERPSWCGLARGRIITRLRGYLDDPLCNHWRTLERGGDSGTDQTHVAWEVSTERDKLAVRRTKRWLAFRFLEVLEAKRFGCQFALRGSDIRWGSDLGILIDGKCIHPYKMTVWDQMGRTYLDGEWVTVPYEAQEPADWGFWWPDQALITDPRVIEDLSQRNPVKAVHAEFIRLMAAYHEASEARRGQIEIMAEAEATGSDIGLREARTILADEYLDVPLQFDSKYGLGIDSKYGLGNFSPNRRLSRPDYDVVLDDAWVEPWGHQPSQRKIISKPEKLFLVGDPIDVAACPAWRIASIGGCKLCPDGLSPNKSKTVCEDKGCEKNHFWDAVNQICVNDRDKRRSRWVQMNLAGGFPDQELEEVQNAQLEHLQDQVKAYAEQEDRSRDYVNIVGSITTMAEERGRQVSYQQSVIQKRKRYPSDRAAESYWVSDPKGWETKYSEDVTPESINVDNAEVLRDVLQRGLALAENEPAVFALNFNGHGIGVQAAGVDIKDMREIIGDEMKGKPLDIVTFDACRMGAYEALLMLEGRTKWVVAHTTNIPLEGWNPDGIGLAILGEDKEKEKGKLVAAGKGMKVAEMIEHMMDEISTQEAGEVSDEAMFTGRTGEYNFDSVVAYRMDRFAEFRQTFNYVLRLLTESLRSDATQARTVEKLLAISQVEANRGMGSKGTHIDFYHVDGFLEEVRKRFNKDPVVKTASKRATQALRSLTRKKPKNEQPRMIFRWCATSELCGQTQRQSIYSIARIYSNPALKALYDFNQAMLAHSISQ